MSEIIILEPFISRHLFIKGSKNSCLFLVGITNDIGIICFQSPEELNDKIEFYLKNDSLRNKIISNSFNIISDKKYSVEFQLDIIQKRILNYQ